MPTTASDESEISWMVFFTRCLVSWNLLQCSRNVALILIPDCSDYSRCAMSISVWHTLNLNFLTTNVWACVSLFFFGRVSPTPVKSPVYWTPVISNCQLNRTCVSPTKVNFCTTPVSWLCGQIYLVWLTYFLTLLLAERCCHWWRWLPSASLSSVIFIF